MISVLCLFLGLSISMNISFVLFLVFILRNKNLSDKIYERFSNNVEVMEDSIDPFKKI